MDDIDKGLLKILAWCIFAVVVIVALVYGVVTLSEAGDEHLKKTNDLYGRAYDVYEPKPGVFCVSIVSYNGAGISCIKK